MSRVRVHNEWDPLEEVIIGRSENAAFPSSDVALRANISADHGSLPKLDCPLPEVPERVRREAAEDLDNLCNVLRELGVTVSRPDVIDTTATIRTPLWEVEQYANYCPRDILLAIGDTIIESPMILRSRQFESWSYRALMLEYMKSGSRYLCAPRPRLRLEDYDFTGTQTSTLKENEPIFDAANVLRAGRDLFYLVSNSGNRAGRNWLQATLRDEYRIHECDMYRGVHIDSTLSLLRPGLVLINPERLSQEDLPAPLTKWDVIVSPSMNPSPEPEHSVLASPWIGMNLLMVSPEVAIVDAHQAELIALLARHRIEAIPVESRHGRLLGGGFHCVSLDVRRRGPLEDYFC